MKCRRFLRLVCKLKLSRQPPPLPSPTKMLYAKSVSLEMNDQTFTVSAVDDTVMFSVQKGKGKPSTNEVQFESWCAGLADYLRQILEFHQPEKWSLIVVLATGSDLRRDFTIDSQVKDIYRLEKAAWDMRGGDTDDDNFEGMMAELADTWVWGQSISRVSTYLGQFNKVLEKKSLARKFSAVIEGKECPVFLETKLTTKNAVVLKCDHCVSVEAWEKQTGATCPLCRQNHLHKRDVKYYP